MCKLSYNRQTIMKSVPESFGQFKIISSIGKGGMGEVFLAQDTRLDRKVAIKFLNEEFSQDADKLNRFIQEAKAVSALNHPNILTVYEIGENDEANFIVTEFKKAIVFFKQAIEKDPNYALAYSGLADTFSQFPTYGDFRPKEYLPQAKAAALKALELDPNLAEAHTSLAQIIIHYDYDFAGAEKSYKRAIELDPNYAKAHQWYAELLSWGSRDDEAIREITKAIELDPFSFAINLSLSIQLARAGRFDEALLQSKKLNELFPNEAGFHLRNGNVYADQGKYDQAVGERLLSAKATKDFKPENIAKWKEAYEKGGWDGFLRMRGEIDLERLNTNQTKDPNGYIRAIRFAYGYANGKDKDKTIEYLTKAYDERERQLLLLKVSKTWDFVRDNPRFKELVRKIGIPE